MWLRSVQSERDGATGLGKTSRHSVTRGSRPTPDRMDGERATREGISRSSARPDLANMHQAAGQDPMDVRLIRFGEIEVEGKRHRADVVIEQGHIRRRHKKPS